jgi:hypothetical protein
MTTSLTIRLDKKQREKLRRKAKVLGKSESSLVREALERELDSRPMSERIGHLKGILSSKAAKLEGWRKVIYEHNWRS